MIKNGILNQTAMNSPLGASSSLAPEGGKRKKQLVATVILTSLIDAFSILVIYLLVNFSNSGEILYISKDMKLPTAQQAEQLIRTTLIKIEKDVFYIEDKPIQEANLVGALVDIQKSLAKSTDENKASLTIQADKKIEYKVLNKIVQAGSHAGFSEIKFAVLAN